MTLPNNILQQVQTYQMAELPFLDNLSVFIKIANKKYQNFQNLPAQLGSTVTFERPPRFNTTNSLVASFEGIDQLTHSLTVDQQISTSVAYDSQQFIFNLQDYMSRVGKGIVRAIGTPIEKNVALNTLNHTYRYFGDGSTSINSFGQLASMLALYRNFGSADGDIKVILPDVVEPTIVNTGLNQFVLDRNNRMANSWEVGDWAGVKFYRSNQTPIHTAGTAGDSAQTLTVVSTNDPTGANITQITFSGVSASDVDCIKQNDILYSLNNLFFKQWIGTSASATKLSIRATADAVSTSGSQVTVNIYPALNAIPGKNQNIFQNIVAGMTFKVLPSHRAGLVLGGDALFLAMPKLPEMVPYPTANAIDPVTGLSMRMYYGSTFGKNEMGLIHDSIWGSTMIDEYALRLVFPINQGISLS